MSKQKSKAELIKHKDRALASLDSYLTSLIQSNNNDLNGKADKLSYWLEDYSRYLSFETSFNPSSLKRYKRGDIIQVHLGYRLCSEEGGLHYAVVLDKANNIHSPVITVVPLTSIKPNKDLSRLKPTEILLGDTIYQQMYDKAKNKSQELNAALSQVEDGLNHLPSDNPSYKFLLDELEQKLKEIHTDITFYDKLKQQINGMKKGSIALVNQITTVSKIRIYDPKTSRDILGGIRLSSEKLDLIDQCIKNNYIK